MYRRFTVSLVCGLLVVLLLGVVVAPSFGIKHIYAQVSADNLTDWDHQNPGSPTAVNTSWGIGFTGNGEYLSEVDFYLVNTTASATGQLRCYLVLAADSASGEPLAGSTIYDIAELDGATWVEFLFDGTYLLTDDVGYVVVVSVYQTLSAEFHFAQTHTAGQYYGVLGTGYNTHPTEGMCYRIYTDSLAGGSSFESGEADETITSLMWWFVYLIVMLAPAWFLGGYLKMGKWGFVVGLAIGAGIGYAFLSGFPLWLLILVAVGEAGLVYSTVSREG